MEWIKYMAILLQCAKSSEIFCQRIPIGEISKEMLPKFCPMKTSVNTVRSVTERYEEDEVRKIYVPPTVTEKEAYE